MAFYRPETTRGAKQGEKIFCLCFRAPQKARENIAFFQNLPNDTFLSPSPSPLWRPCIFTKKSPESALHRLNYRGEGLGRGPARENIAFFQNLPNDTFLSPPPIA